MKVNLLVNYGWEWDLSSLKKGNPCSQEVSRIDLIVRWGGERRLSGFLPVQSIYADSSMLGINIGQISNYSTLNMLLYGLRSRTKLWVNNIILQ